MLGLPVGQVSQAGMEAEAVKLSAKEGYPWLVLPARMHAFVR